MKKTNLCVFSTARKVREFYESKKGENALLDKALSAVDFFKKAALNDKREASEYERLLLMKKACDKTRKARQAYFGDFAQNAENAEFADLDRQNSSDKFTRDIEFKPNFSKFHIPKEFFEFLKNNEYLFSFFREMALANKSVEDLKQNDYYAVYVEHLEILDELLKHYLNELKAANLCDEISHCKEYKINGDFLGEFDEIDFYLDGFLNDFEFKILQKCAEFSRVNLHFKTSKFNLESFKHFAIFRDFELEKDKIYALNLNENKIIKNENLEQKNNKIILKKFEMRALQAAFVFDEISNFIRADIMPQDIVVITPDESFCEILRVFDSKKKLKMLNFASGISIKQTQFYQALSAIYQACKNEDFSENLQEKNAYFSTQNMIDFDIDNVRLKSFEVRNFAAFKRDFEEKIDFIKFENLIKPLFENEDIELKNKLENELNFIKSLLKENALKMREILELFFMRISGIKSSDVGGGAVTVMGLLESRGMRYKGVIIVDFNDEFIPKRSVNSMFLNNEVRKNAGLISAKMHENLQRFYYENLIANAQMVAISYVENEQSLKSRFLKELNLDIKEKNIPPEAYAKALCDVENINQINLSPLEVPKLKYDIFAKPLSCSRFELFLKHKRTFFYRYLFYGNHGLKEPRNLGVKYDAAALGNALHEILAQYFEKNKDKFNYNDLINLLERANLSRLDKSIYKLRFKEFESLEKAHFAQGWRVKFCEKEWSDKDANKEPMKPYKIGSKTINLIGKIDRVDEKDGRHLIIDYKSGEVPKKSYQLAFYQALLGGECECFFYDLVKMKKEKGKDTKSLSDLNAEFEALLKASQEVEFENEKPKDYCAYAIIYDKKDLR